MRAARKDWLIGMLSPPLLALRACAQFLGVLGGVLYTRRHRAQSINSKGISVAN